MVLIKLLRELVHGLLRLLILQGMHISYDFVAGAVFLVRRTEVCSLKHFFSGLLCLIVPALPTSSFLSGDPHSQCEMGTDYLA